MQRKLTAILSADVVGYSGLMEADETGTLDWLKANRAAIFDPLVSTNGGRVFKLLGDGALVEFPSVVSAVTCALAIQEATATGEPGVAAEKRIRYRIGVNLGDIITDGDDIYGEGVNVAARLQTLAPNGGVAVSRTVRDNLDGKIACTFEDLGEHQVKNHERPVHAFSVRPAVRDKLGASGMGQRNKPSICVLPFANMSGDTEQEYFADGITEDIITDLSKVSSLGVVSRNTAFTFKSKSVKVRQVAQELEVGYVLEGSVRKAGGRVRITAQLISGANDEHVWAERYDRNLDDIFALQDEISEAIVKALKLKLLPEEKKAIERRGTDSVEAYNLYLMARQEYMEGNPGDTRACEAVIRLADSATKLDPQYAQAWTLIALAQWRIHFQHGGPVDGFEAAEQALAVDPELADAHAVKAKILSERGLLEEAGHEIDTAIRLGSDSWEVNNTAGIIRFRQARLKEATAYWEKAVDLELADFVSAGMLITCYAALGDHEARKRIAKVALERCEKVIAQDRNNLVAVSWLSTALAVLGEGDRAREWMKRALLIDPNSVNTRYNFACTLGRDLKDVDGAIELLGPAFECMAIGLLNHTKIDPDLDVLRDNPRFKAMMAAAEKRLAAASDSPARED